ncbi:MAG TPA: molybdopterin-dependent oxidoreductase, partial [Albitalea sp.]|nr:molybdopterin-dependent oxidoreductase [Albitalea sp.]
MTSFDRRGVLRLGAAALLSGCSVTETDRAQAALRAISRFNDRAQAALFRSEVMAPLYPASALTLPFRFNAFYTEASVPEIDIAAWQLQVGGKVRDRAPWRLDAIKNLPSITQATRLVCIEGWSAVGQWTGVPLGLFLEHIGADTRAKYVGFRCADGYYTSIDMASALHPQTQLA